MQLVAQISIPQPVEERSLILSADTPKKHRKLIGEKAYVLFALQMSYPDKKNPDVHVGTFCEEWKLSEHEFDAALAQLQKKGYVYRPSSVIQLELFQEPQEPEEG